MNTVTFSDNLRALKGTPLTLKARSKDVIPYRCTGSTTPQFPLNAGQFGNSKMEEL